MDALEDALDDLVLFFISNPYVFIGFVHILLAVVLLTISWVVQAYIIGTPTGIAGFGPGSGEAFIVLAMAGSYVTNVFIFKKVSQE